MLAIAEASCATRVEFANVQYYGWALANRQNLLPTREQLDSSLEILKRAQERLRGKMRIEYVVPDYYAKFPKACMGGWGRKLITDCAQRRCFAVPRGARDSRPQL